MPSNMTESSTSGYMNNFFIHEIVVSLSKIKQS
jgi:hypothetical protein